MLTLSIGELHELTGYRQPCKILAELQRQGFYRARINRLGEVVLERAHYDAVCAGQSRPANEPKLRTPTLRKVAA